MTKKKTQPEETSPLRTPKAKKTLGLKVPQIPMPHLHLVQQMTEPETKPEVVDPEENSLPSQTTHTRQTRQSEAAREIAPTKDFQKIPNSITKTAIPEGLFKQGKSKQLYDVLYSLTRGAIEPKRSVRISKTKLRKLAGIGSRVTFDSCVSHLEAVGLLQLTVYTGEHEGNEFEVNLPEEISLPSLPSLTGQTRQTRHAQKQDTLLSPDRRHTRQSLIVENESTSGSPKTSFKTLEYIDDDAPVAAALDMLNEAARAATGKDLTKKDLEAFLEIIEIIIAETALAKTRTKSVSVYLKFAAENLRRRLYSKPRFAAPFSKPKPFEPGIVSDSKPPEAELSDIEPMSREARENALVILRPIVRQSGIEALENFHSIYAAEDLEWLMERLK
jgi:hypothetical protein